MSAWSTAARTIQAILAVIAAIGFFRYWVRTGFWFPRYVHVMAAVALAIGVWLLVILPHDGPIDKGDYRLLKYALFIAAMPALVYVAFVFYGGQRAAHDGRLEPGAVTCPYCGGAQVLPGAACPACRQIVDRAATRPKPP
jgi:hypothetical protein